MSEIEESQIIEERVYIGNLPYTAKQDEIEDLIKGFEYVSVELPTRTLARGKKVIKRPAGFAFVTFKDKDVADQALQFLEGKSIGERVLEAKHALPPKLSPKRKNEKEKENESPKEENTVRMDVKKKAKDRKPKPKRVPLEEGTPSATTVFITNLEENVDAKQLRSHFADLEPKFVKVPKRSLPRHIARKLIKENVPIRNRGIAFITFTDSEAQQRAIEKFNGTEINGKPVEVAIAIDSKVKGDQEDQEDQTEQSQSAEN